MFIKEYVGLFARGITIALGHFGSAKSEGHLQKLSQTGICIRMSLLYQPPSIAVYESEWNVAPPFLLSLDVLPTNAERRVLFVVQLYIDSYSSHSCRGIPIQKTQVQGTYQFLVWKTVIVMTVYHHVRPVVDKFERGLYLLLEIQRYAQSRAKLSQATFWLGTRFAAPPS
jgi:hypothetical protein